MSKKDYDDFDVLDDYFEDEGDPFLFNQVVGTDLSNVSYEDFNKVNDEYEEEEEDDVVVYQEEDLDDSETVIIHNTTKKSFEDRILEKESLMDVLNVFWTWFRRFGIVIIVILVAYYITQGLFKDLLQYLFALIFAFGFGYAFMAVLTKIKEDR